MGKKAQDARMVARDRRSCAVEGRPGVNTVVSKKGEGEVAITGYGQEYTGVHADSAAVAAGNSLDSNPDIVVEGWRTDVLARAHEPAEEVGESTWNSLRTWQSEAARVKVSNVKKRIQHSTHSWFRIRVGMVWPIGSLM